MIVPNEPDRECSWSCDWGTVRITFPAKMSAVEVAEFEALTLLLISQMKRWTAKEQTQ